jgi:hypothetical protein
MVKLLRRIINLFKKCKMPKINFLTAYPLATTPLSGNSILIGSLASGGATKNFQMSDIAAYVMSAPVSTITLQQVCDQGAVTTTGITVAGNTTIGGTLGVSQAATFALGVTIDNAGLAVNGSGGIIVGSTSGISSFGPISGTALNSTGGLLVSGTSILGEIDSAGPADIADTLTLSKATGTGLQVDANVNIDGETHMADKLYLDKPTGNGLEVTSNIYVGGDVGVLGIIIANGLNITQSTPASASATGVVGTIATDVDYIYVCTATDTWKRVAIATW